MPVFRLTSIVPVELNPMKKSREEFEKSPDAGDGTYAPYWLRYYFHLLRRKAALLREDPLPLIILTPKGHLRDPRLASPPPS